MHMYLSDIWSRSNFWVTLHTSWVLMSVNNCCKCWLHSLDLFEWFWWCLWPKMALEMSQTFPTVSLDITNKASPRLSLVETFARIAVYKWICRSDTQTSSRPCLQSFTDCFIFHFYWQKHSSDSLIWLSWKRLILLLINKIIYTQSRTLW